MFDLFSNDRREVYTCSVGFDTPAFFSRGEWALIDGDKIAALCADFIHAEMANLGLDKVRVFPLWAV